MRLSLLATILSFVALGTAHIFNIKGPANYTAKENSHYPLTFETANGPITNEDFSAAVGLVPASNAHGPPALGTFVHNFDLENTGHGNTGTGSFTLNLPLPKSRFIEGPGKYVITAAVTNAVGALWNVQLLFFNITTDVKF